MPFRNAAPTLLEAAASVVDQLGVSLELIAVDDGSTDGGAALLEELARRDRRVRLVSGPGEGIARALERGRRHCRAPLIARMDADDLCLPGRLAKQVRAIAEDPRVAVLAAEVMAFPEEAIGTGLQVYVTWQNGLHTPDDHSRDLFIESPVCHPSVLLRAEALDAVGGWRDFDGPEDYDLWLRLHAAGWRIAKLPEVLLKWRHQAGRMTFNNPRCGLDKFRETKAPHLASHLLRTGKPICMWGAGQTGKRLARALERHGVKVRRFVDIDPAKIGRPARHTRIDAAVSVSHDEYVVVGVGARGAREIIRGQLMARDFLEVRDFICAA